MELKIETKVFPDRIELEENWKDQSFSVQQMLTRQIIDLKDNAVRDALISLGWTPPAESNSSIEDHPNFEAFIRAFWRRIEPYKNDHGKELPDELPSEFLWAVGTASILLREKTEQLEDKLDKALSNYGDNWYDGFVAARDMQRNSRHFCIEDCSDDEIREMSEGAEEEWLSKAKRGSDNDN